MAFLRKINFWRYQFQKWVKLVSRKKLKARHFLLFGLVKLILVIVFFLYKWNFLCSNLPIHNVIQNVCDQYSYGEVVGNLCDTFCGERASLVVDSCQTWHGGKDIVFSATIDDNKKVFVKGRKANFDLDPSEQLVWHLDNNGESKLPPNLSTFESMVRTFLKDNMAMEFKNPEEDLLETLWDFSIRTTVGKVMNTSMKNLWTLIQDNEYVFSKVYEHHNLFPKVYGTCGGLYAVEHLDPLTLPPFFGSKRFSDWSIRVSVAKAILEFLDELDSVFDFPVHLCDVKSSHFATSQTGNVKFLDLDSVFLKPALDKLMLATGKCEKHSDCDVFDCKGQCDLIEGNCVNGVVNNNLQIICEKVFLSRKLSQSPDALFSSGFLHSKHMNNRLEMALDRCANPNSASDNTRLAADEPIRFELSSALQEIVEFSVKMDSFKEN